MKLCVYGILADENEQEWENIPEMSDHQSDEIVDGLQI